MHVSHGRNVAIQRAVPCPGYLTLYMNWAPFCRLLPINTHIHRQHLPPREQQGLALGDYSGEKKLSEGQSSASPLVETMGRQKTPFLPLSPLLAMPAKILGWAALQKKDGRQAADPSFCLHDEKK